jgi:threonine/homoserine/homoserine lactone efflux protein
MPTMNFLPSLPALAAYLAGVVVIVITPGPDMTYFLGRTVSLGVLAGIAAMLGAVTGLLVHSTLVAFGLSALVIASPTLFTAVKLAGAAYLAWLAIDAIRHGSALNVEKARGRETRLGRVWLQGLGINLLNPKIVLFFMTFLPQFVSAGDPNAPQKLLFLGVLFSVVTIPLTLPMILAASAITGYVRSNRRIARAIDYLFAGVFGAFAVRILLTERV